MFLVWTCSLIPTLSCLQLKGRVLTWGLWMRSLVHQTRSPLLQHHGPKPVPLIRIKEGAQVPESVM